MKNLIYFGASEVDVVQRTIQNYEFIVFLKLYRNKIFQDWNFKMMSFYLLAHKKIWTYIIKRCL